MMQAEYRALSELEKSCADRRLACKAKIVLLALQGWSSTMISRKVGVSAPTAETVVRRYHPLGRAGLFGKQWVKLSTTEHQQLSQLGQKRQGDALKRVYAKVVLDASQGIAPKHLALQHKLSPSTVRTLLYRFENRRLAALEPASYGGREANKARWGPGKVSQIPNGSAQRSGRFHNSAKAPAIDSADRLFEFAGSVANGRRGHSHHSWVDPF